MDKKDIYEHLAKIYLDASSKKKRKSKHYPKLFKTLFYVSVVIIFGLTAFIAITLRNKKSFLNTELALVLQPDAVKINFHFDPAKKEIYSVNLKLLDLIRFKNLGFQAKKVNYKNNISLRIEFINEFKEKSEVYIRDIKNNWEDYKINLADFKNISDWTRMVSLAFIVEEWNTKDKHGVVYIDNVRFLR